MPKLTIGNRSYPPVLSDAQKGVMADLLNDPRWEKFVADQPQTRIGNRTYPDDTTGVGTSPPRDATNKIMRALETHAASLGKSPNDLTLPELNEFISQYGGPTPNAMYKLPSNY